jgi:hypothetical protein
MVGVSREKLVSTERPRARVLKCSLERSSLIESSRVEQDP